MSHRWRFLMAVLLLAGPAAAQDGTAPNPVCNRPEVLDVVAEDIIRSGSNAVLIPGEFGEIPAGRPGAVRCAVRLRTTYFDTNRFGSVPQYIFSVVEFTVRFGRNGLFVNAVSLSP